MYYHCCYLLDFKMSALLSMLLLFMWYYIVIIDIIDQLFLLYSKDN